MLRKKILNKHVLTTSKGAGAKVPVLFAICGISLCELLYVMMLIYV
jgi:hypothetical protein